LSLAGRSNQRLPAFAGPAGWGMQLRRKSAPPNEKAGSLLPAFSGLATFEDELG
jgi:hypothetical protein